MGLHTKADKTQHGRLAGHRARLTRQVVLAWAVLATITVVLTGAFVILLPSPVAKLEAMRTSTTVMDRDGRLLCSFIGAGEERAIYVGLSDVSPHLIHATVAVEDRRFYLHFGVDPIALLRAAVVDLYQWRVVSGASTITMQLARLMEPKPSTLKSKAIEAFRALQLEWHLTKDQILEAYLNFAPYGGNVIGVEMAARRYFGKRARDLTTGEAALLAGLPQAPSRLRPDRHAGRAKRRRDMVLREMWRKGYISRRQLLKAQATAVSARAHPLPFRAPHFAALVKERSGSGRKLTTTLDGELQALAERVLRGNVSRLRSRGITNAGMVLIENATGAVAAMVGSADFFAEEDQGQINAALAPRSPGSALKPFTYALAFERGVCTPDTVLADVPCQFSGYSPENYDRRYHGPVPASDALARSLNVPAVRLLNAVGPQALEELLKRLGIATLDRRIRGAGLALTLGACEVRLVELTNAYACLARLGLHRPYTIVAGGVRDTTRLVSDAACYLVAEALLNTRPSDCDGPTVALKTGTSYGHRDAWAVGFNPEWTIGVWVGNFSGEPARALVGASVAAPMVYEVFRAMYSDRPGHWYARPASVGDRPVCALSGRAAGPYCSETRSGLFIRGVSSTQRCQVHRRQMVDDATGCVLCARCAAGRRHHYEVVEQWPVGLAAWLAARGRCGPCRRHLARCSSARDGMQPRILSPQEGQCYARAAGERVSSSRLLLTAAASPSCSRLSWFVNGSMYRAAAPAEPVFWPAAPGRYTVTCVDDSGQGASVRIVVR